MSGPSLLLNSPHPHADGALLHLPREYRLSMLALASLIFFHTCGGAFGLEPLVGVVGPGWAVFLIIFMPLFWSLPTALMVAELTSLLPEEGGFYIWIREAFGPFWAVQQACWAMSCSMVWLAMYPVLFVTYLSFLIPELAISPTAVHARAVVFIRWLVAVLVIALGMVLNLRGAHAVGRWAKLEAYFILGAFALLLLIWFRHDPAPSSIVEVIRSDFGSGRTRVLLLGLSFLMFNYSGWENASTYASEVQQPQRNYPRALALALFVMVLSYVLPVIAGVTVTTNPALWSSETGWPAIAELIGGRWLGALVAIAGLFSMMGLFNAQLLFSSRLPYVLAREGWLPKVFADVPPGAPAPRSTVLTFSFLVAVFVALSFGSLAIIQCILYVSSLTLQFLALIAFRIRQPTALRSFRVPAGWLGMSYVCVAPFVVAMIVLFTTLHDWKSFPYQLLAVCMIFLGGVILFWARRKTASQ